MAIRSGAAALSALVLLLTLVAGCGGTAEDNDPTPDAAAAPREPGTAAPSEAESAAPHTVVIVLENHEFDEVIGNPEAPFLNRLARRGALATRYYAIAHPSLSNYLAILAGATFGLPEDCTDCSASGPSLAEQLSGAGISWRAYMEGMPEPCFAGAQDGEYVKRHNPFMYFPAISGNPGRCRNVVPGTWLEEDLAHHTLPSFAWFTPNLCGDGHSCDFEDADTAMANLIPRIRSQLGQDGVLVVTFDEGTSDLGCCAVAAGGRVMTIVVGPGVPPGTRITSPYTHYSLLAAIEDRYDLPRLRNARSARPLPLAFDEG
jgi:phosphatidylinositol-3-phosphatase